MFTVAQSKPWLNISHHFVEFRKVQRLAAVAPCFGRVGMHFHDQAICARGHCNARQRGDQIAMTCRVAGIGDHRKMRDLLEQRNRGDVECVARRCFKGADAALA